jgi:hypothetical protein
MKSVRITHKATGMKLAEGSIGWGITPFEGNYYIRRKHLATPLRSNFIPGLCVYKLLYVWLDLYLDDSQHVRSLGWFYWLPNPLLPFIAFRTALPGSHPELEIEKYEN